MYEYIKINGQNIPRPPAFAPETEDVFSGEFETLLKNKKKDRIGYRFADMTLEWSALPQTYIDILDAMNGISTIEFDTSETVVTEQIVRTSKVCKRHKYPQDGEYWWTDVSVSIEFLNTHRG